MSTMSPKLVNAGLFFLFIFLSGFWLSRTGKPYSLIIITMHKLIGLATGAFLVMTVYRILKAAPINQVEITAIVLTVLFFIGLVATGGLLSAEKPVPEAVSMIHKLFPYLTVFSSGITIYLLS
jgi:hypothetical protein